MPPPQPALKLAACEIARLKKEGKAASRRAMPPSKGGLAGMARAVAAKAERKLCESLQHPTHGSCKLHLCSQKSYVCFIDSGGAERLLVESTKPQHQEVR